MTNSEDYAWEKVKEQTEPLATRGKTTLATSAKPISKPRPIRDGDLINQTTVKRKEVLPAREDGHRKVRRGRVALSGRLDLHGMTIIQARKSLLLFLQNGACQNNITVLVITGKGSRGEGALRLALSNWLQQVEFTPLVSGYAQAHARHGGDGAWYLFLRRQRGV
ncbi:MAG: Smr/MutS family protein [Robiginitomaculum sp.]|nr:Smr/MutS family protein [Robiginitomaculum sp.]MBL1431558.1 Smr/MutS family protein [Robiginitomaculum sp.]